MSQNEHKTSLVSNNSCVFDVTPNDFRCTDRRSWLLHFVLHSYSGTVIHNGAAQFWVEIFNDANHVKTELGPFRP